MKAHRVWMLAGSPSLAAWLAFFLLYAIAKRWESREPLSFGVGFALAVGVAVALRRFVGRRPEVQEAVGRLTPTERQNLEAYSSSGLSALLVCSRWCSCSWWRCSSGPCRPHSPGVSVPSRTVTSAPGSPSSRETWPWPTSRSTAAAPWPLTVVGTSARGALEVTTLL